MASFLKKTNFNKTEVEASTAKIGTLGKSPLKTGALSKGPVTPKPLGGSLLKKKAEPQEVDLETEVKEETKPAAKPKLGAKKSLLKKSIDEEKEKVNIESSEEQPVSVEAMPVTEKIEDKEEIDITHCPEDSQGIFTEEDGSVTIKAKTIEIKEEPKEEEKKETTTKKKTSRRSSKAKQENKAEQQVLKAVEVDETKRVSLEEMDQIMRPIVAPTTALWEQEKKDILEALNNIKVEQDMNMSQVKSCLSELDELKFEILPKQHDAETMYDGTKQNYDTVKAIAIANGSGSNAEARKAEGIIACQNFVTPSGEVVDLHQYMLLIEERYKFYEKIAEGVNFKKYSLVNYNNAIKAEKEGK